MQQMNQRKSNCESLALNVSSKKFRWGCVLFVAVMHCRCTVMFGQESKFQHASPSTVSNCQMPASRWPFEASEGQFLIHSTVSLARIEPSLSRLRPLPDEIKNSLQISIVDQPVHVVVLENREALDMYVKRLLPDAPSRRALYIRHRGPGLVLTYYHSAWLTDVRHECTHALLDASGLKLPLWLDEGIAEYFETESGSPIAHATHKAAVQSQIRYGQVADLIQLEQLDSASIMLAKDYRDAWSITAFLMHSSEQTKKAFQTYLLDLQNGRTAGLLSHRLHGSVQFWRDDYANFYSPAGMH